MIKILGIDPSTQCTGYCVINDEKKLIYHSNIQYYGERDVNVRIDGMIRRLIKVFDEYEPDVCYIENTWNKNNIETTKKLTNIIGAVRCLCILHDCSYNMILPSEWRSVIGIDGGKNTHRDEFKARAIWWVKANYGLDVSEDEAESICIAYTGATLNNNMFEEEELF